MKKNRIIYLDILNIIAIFAVIALHCNAIVHGSPMTRAWSTSLIIECLCYFAVPLFFMISGANLMTYRTRYDTKTFFKKRILKVIIPLLVWATIMFIWKIFIVKSISIESVNTPIKLLNSFFANREESTYYFMFEILAVYMIMPLLSLLTLKKYRKTLWLIVLLFFIFNGFIPNICKLIGIHWYSGFGVPLNGYVVYAILGYLLSTSNSKFFLNSKNMIILSLFALVGVLYRYISTFVLSKGGGIVDKTTWGYSSWHCMLLAVFVFLFIKNLKFFRRISERPRICNIIVKISNCSFGIYLIHLIVKYYFVVLFQINTASWIFRTLGIVIIYLVSLFIVLLLKKIPLIKKIVP